MAARACRGENIFSAPGTAGDRAAEPGWSSRWRRVSDCALGCEQQREMGNLPAAAAESTGFRLRDGALETLRGPATAAAADGRKSPTRPPSW